MYNDAFYWSITITMMFSSFLLKSLISCFESSVLSHSLARNTALCPDPLWPCNEADL